MENAHRPATEPSDRLCFGREEVGHLTERCIRNRLEIMIRKEREIYDYCNLLPIHNRSRPWVQLSPDPEWRASIVKWVSTILSTMFCLLITHEDLCLFDICRDFLPTQNYNVVDHFKLSREVVSLSMLLFDRFFAAKPTTDRDLVLLCSIATLHIAIKTNESAAIKLSTLIWFGRGRFSKDQIACMELQVLFDCKWMVNPPTTLAFVMHLLLLWDPPPLSGVGRNDRASFVLERDWKLDVLESSRFLCGKCSLTHHRHMFRRDLSPT